jgi:hypothetical protein
MQVLRKYIMFGILAAVCLLTSGCDKYLDVKPKGYQLLSSTADYEQWMNSALLWVGYAELNNLADINDYPRIEVPPTLLAQRMYLWQPQYTTTTASLWGNHYDKINAYNSVINGIDEATGTDQQKASLKAEALVSRALEYLYLVNEYGKQYDSTTAATDPGVPIVTSDDVTQVVPARSSVKEVYDFIIGDLNSAIPNLPIDNVKNRYRPSIAAGYSVLARLYLIVGAYNKARENAALALQYAAGQSMIDYTKMASVSTLPLLTIRPDAIFARGASYNNYTPTIEFLKTFNTNDRRLRFFYNPLGNFTFPTRGTTGYFSGGSLFSSIYDNQGTSIQEMKLIIAESAARSNDLAEALKQLDEVRKNRIPAANYQPYQSTDQEFVLQKVLEERLFEFPFNSLRWFDMRRLDAKGKMPAVKRYDAQGNVIATLEPKSPRYVLQVPEMVMQYNRNMVQNP